MLNLSGQGKLMNKKEFLSHQSREWTPWSFWSIAVILLTGLILSALSGSEICLQRCSAGHDYRFFGLSFATTGILFFTSTLLLHLLSLRYSFLAQGVVWLISAACGAEVMLVLIQKYQIGHWCPICLTIGVCVGLAAVILLVDSIKYMLFIEVQNE